MSTFIRLRAWLLSAMCVSFFHLLPGCSSDEVVTCSIKEIDGQDWEVCPDGSKALIGQGQDGQDDQPGEPGQDGQNGDPGEPGQDGQPGEDGQDGLLCLEDGVTDDGLSAWTGPLLQDWQENREIREECYAQAEIEYDICMANMKPSCLETWNAADDMCDFYFAGFTNDLPGRMCGAVMITLNPFDFSEEDSDGDGISNYMEYRMGLNPCTPYSSGCWTLSDAAMDYDNDGIPNGQDQYPRCPQDKYHSDCV